MAQREKLRSRLSRAWATLRGKQAVVRMYNAARPSRLRADYVTADSSADTELVSSLTQLRAQSRALCRNVNYARRAKTLVINNVIGSGIGMQAEVHTTRGVQSKRINDEIEDRWKEWARAEYCHTGGRYSFSSLERALMGQVFEAGEVFIRKHYRSFGDSNIPFALEMIEAERVADDRVAPSFQVAGKNEYRMGVEVDEFYRPVAYYIRNRHPGELRFKDGSPDNYERVPASEIIHLAVGDRWPQTRGEPWMASSISTFHNAAGYVDAEVTRARVQASQPWTIETPDAITSFGEEMEDGSVEMTVEPGVAKRLNPGEKMNVPPINSPNAGVESFMRYLLRDIAAGVGPSYESLSKDYSQSNYSSSRLALLDDRDLWRVFQSWFLDSFRVPVHRDWLHQAVLADTFKTFTITQWALDRKKYEAVRFRPRGWSWVDPTKEVTAFKEAVRCGFMTMQDVVSSGGADIEEVFDQRRRELDLAESYDLSFDTDTPEADEPEVPPPPDPDDETDEDESEDPADVRVFHIRSTEKP